VVSIAPLREFCKAERRIVRDFVENGGLFLITVGYEERRGSQELLADFGFEVGPAPTNRLGAAEPQPMGYFKVPYLDLGDYKPFVRYHASWPVSCSSTNARVIARGHGDVPVIVVEQVGKGKFVVVGDSGFVLNKNLEREDGQPIDGLRENADFWRWFLTVLRDQPAWIPPKATVAQSTPGTARRPAGATTPPRPVESDAGGQPELLQNR
jgi:hypothetical protein